LYGAFGIWVGTNERFDQAHLHPISIWASMVLFGLLYRPFFRRFENQSAALYFALYNLGRSCF